MLSAKKEEEIKSAFERLKKETGVNASKEEESKKVLEAFIELYQKVSMGSKELELNLEQISRRNKPEGGEAWRQYTREEDRDSESYF